MRYTIQIRTGPVPIPIQVKGDDIPKEEEESDAEFSERVKLCEGKWKYLVDLFDETGTRTGCRIESPFFDPADADHRLQLASLFKHVQGAILAREKRKSERKPIDVMTAPVIIEP